MLLRRFRFLLRYLLILGALCSVSASADSLLVVVGPGSTVEQLDERTIRNLFLSREKFFPDTSNKAIPVDLPSTHEAYIGFYQRIANMSPRSVSRYRARVVFSGKGGMPQRAGSIDEIREILQINNYAIAYLPAGSNIEGLKVVYRID